VLEARRIAWIVLVRVEKGGAFANRALDAALAEAGQLDARDVALATELSYGTLRRQISIDHALQHFSKLPLGELDFDTRALLRLGAYQLLHLRIPERAAVHATVELAKEIRQGRPVKYVNAVLRALARERANILIPPASVDPEGHLSITESMPRWLAADCLARYGFEATRRLFDAMNHPAPLTLRVNRRTATRAEVQRQLERELGLVIGATRFSPAGLVVEEARAPAALLRPQEGRWQAQDEAAQLVGFFAGVRPGLRVLDACAAPGGKTCHLAELMDDQGVVDAVDIHAGKARDIATGAERLGLTIVRTHAADASGPLPFAPADKYDLVLADAPCSGLGTLRRHPELKLRRTEADVLRLAELQRRILDNVADYVRPGGVLVYAVCTFTRAEGEDQVAAFLGHHPDFSRAPPPAGPVDWTGLVDAAGDLVTDPARHGADAFYAARLVRKAAE
jgi:16S rRNA (cytosine967-C5)-methyltransferase